MSVKRRLYLSNILMLVLPIVLVIATSACLLLIYQGVTGVRGKPQPPMNNGETIPARLDLARQLSADLTETEGDASRFSRLDDFNGEYAESGLRAFWYQGNRRIYPAQLPAPVPDGIDMPGEGSSALLTESYAIYRVPAGAGMLALIDTESKLDPGGRSRQQLYTGLFLLAVLILIVVATNRLLTRFVFRSIVNPIEMLAEGVHQLRDGNLTYRIRYVKQDEFAEVCRDFNRMAEQLSDMVEERSRNERSRRELIAGISHDLRTPLTSIKAYLEGLEKGVASTPRMQAKYFATIKSKVEHLEHVISQLFLFSKLDVGEFPLYLERVELGAELKRMSEAFAAEYKPKGLDLRLEGTLPTAIAVVDPVQFRNVIQNVLENSLRYTDQDRAEVVLEASETDRTVEILLADNGPGVRADELARLFDVFYRSDDSRKRTELGSGLGLAISSKVIERLGGRITAELVPSGGLGIRIVLPTAKSTEGLPSKGAEYEKDTDY